ncbi:type IV secretion system DNA-binding domain-containing protein [Candidatus Peregrinibacteria bacterium]|nr:type IV secretion system DNA-binding domain-containing protein [Candidatus Peregrinibacteria bacterium]
MQILHIAEFIAVWILIVAVLLWRFRVRKNLERSLNMVFLQISVPIKDSKEDRERDSEQYASGKSIKDVLEVMTLLYESLHSIYSGDFMNKLTGQDFFSCEYVVLNAQMRFFMVVPRHLQSLIEKQVTAQYTDVFIEQVDDFSIFRDGYQSAGAYLKLSKPYMYPIRTYQYLGSDPFNNLANAMSKIERDEGVAIQLMLRPMPNGWQDEGREKAEELFQGKRHKKGILHRLNVFSWIGTLLRILIRGAEHEKFGEDDHGGKDTVRTTALMEEQIKLMETKNVKVGFETVIRIVSSAKSSFRAKQITKEVKNAFVQYNAPNLNSFGSIKHFSLPGLIKGFILRDIKRDWIARLFYRHPMILCSEELASIFHFPNIKYNRLPVIKWQEFKIAPAPSNMPTEGLFLGYNNYRGSKTEVRIKRDDRRRHFYMIGKSGTGKSTILNTMLRQDLANGEGICLIDPHGDLVQAVMPHIPRKRADDVVLFDPGDLERPMGLNILEAYTKEQKEFMSQEALSIFIKLFGEEIMGPRLQHYFRNGCLTLMDDDEEGATLIDLPRLFTDDSWQKYKVTKVKNPVVRGFWEKEMASTGAREKQEMIPYFSAKFGPFVTNAQIRNIIGQTKSGFDFRKVMDEGRILLCNLSKGKLGDLNAQLLGMIMVSKLQMAAIGRVDTPVVERHDFYMYVDEFQNFVTESFASILSEARKYRLSLIIAHQYISQITKMGGGGKGSHEDTTIRDAVFGNVGSMMCFKIGAADAEYMAKEFSPVFSDQDLINIANYQAYLKLNIDNATSRAFSMATVYDPNKGDVEAAEAFKQLSRLKFARERRFVEREIYRRVGTKFEDSDIQ